MSRSLHSTSLGYISFHRHLDRDPSMKFIICDSKNYFCIQRGRKRPRDLFGFRLRLSLMCAQVSAKIFMTYKEGIRVQTGGESWGLKV